MKGKEIIDHIVRSEMPDLDQVREKCVRQSISQKQSHKRPFFRPVGAFATVAAVICLVVLGNMFVFPPSNNIFSLKAYAMEQQADGTIGTRAVDLLKKNGGWSGFSRDGNFYLSVGLQCEGENIKSVEFTTDEGFFAKQYIKRDENGKIVAGQPMAVVGESKTIVLYGADFEKAGNKLTLEKDAMNNDLLIFWGWTHTIYDENLYRPDKVDVRAVATFNDGKTQEQIVTLVFSGEGVYVFERTDGEDGYWEVPSDIVDGIEAPLIPSIMGEVSDLLRADGTLEDVYINTGDVKLYEETGRKNVWLIGYSVKPKPEHYSEWLAKGGTESRNGWVICKPIFVEITGAENSRLKVNILGTEL